VNDKKQDHPSDIEFWESVWMAKNLSHEQLLNNVSGAVRSQHIIKALPQNGLILDAGCGDGKWEFYLSAQSYHMIGVDYTIDTLQRNQKTTHDHQYSCKFLCADISNFPIRSNSINGYLSIGVWEHFQTEEQVNLASEAFKILQPGGIIVIDVPNSFSPWTITRKIKSSYRKYKGLHNLWQRNMSKKSLTNLCESVGFETIRCINCDVQASFKLAFLLKRPRILKIVPNPFYFVRNSLLNLATKLEDIFPGIGYDTIYIGRKP
jgi:SAM-dependent methyltransferase